MLHSALGVVAAVTLSIASATAALAQRAPTDDQIRQQMIQESIRSYRGNCPCPYNAVSNGSRCGARSAYSRPGGASPLCYPQDISEAMLSDYKRRMNFAR